MLKMLPLHWKHPSFEICRVIINLPQSHQKCIKDKQIIFFWFVISMLFEAQFIKDIDKIDRHTNRFGFSDDFFKNWKHPSFEICRVIINLPQSHQKCIKDKQIIFFWFVISMLFEAQFIKDIDKIDRHTNRFGFSDDFF